MSAAKHTPGPWRWHIARTMQHLVVDTVEGFRGFGVSMPIMGHRGYREEANPGEYEANARLIAAAPDLLEACEAALTLLDSRADENGPDRWLLLRNAIAKARGE